MSKDTGPKARPLHYVTAACIWLLALGALGLSAKWCVGVWRDLLFD